MFLLIYYSKLGIVVGNVPDSEHKIFIGGLPYHLNESQVMELLGAFGPIRAFHLVKSDPKGATSKGYCFVEYTDPNVTAIAVTGLNGMDVGGGKSLSARIAAARGMAGNDAAHQAQLEAEAEMASHASFVAAPPVAAPVQSEVDALLNAALGGAVAPSAPIGGAVAHMQHQAQPDAAALADMAAAYLNQAFPGGAPAQAPSSAAMQTPGSIMTRVAASNAAEIASAALNAAFGLPSQQPSQPSQDVLMQHQQQQMLMQQQQQQMLMQNSYMQKTRVLVLLNMVTDQDLATDEDYNDLKEEVREESQKYGRLLSIRIPRVQVRAGRIDGFLIRSV